MKMPTHILMFALHDACQRGIKEMPVLAGTPTLSLVLLPVGFGVAFRVVVADPSNNVSVCSNVYMCVYVLCVCVCARNVPNSFLSFRLSSFARYLVRNAAPSNASRRRGVKRCN